MSLFKPGDRAIITPGRPGADLPEDLKYVGTVVVVMGPAPSWTGYDYEVRSELDGHEGYAMENRLQKIPPIDPPPIRKEEPCDPEFLKYFKKLIKFKEPVCG